MNEGLLDLEEAKKRLNWYEKKYGPYIERRGLHNFKNLFRMPNLYEWTILFMLFLTLFGAYAYKMDIQTCREFINRTITDQENIDKIVQDRIQNYEDFKNRSTLNLTLIG